MKFGLLRNRVMNPETITLEELDFLKDRGFIEYWTLEELANECSVAPELIRNNELIGISRPKYEEDMRRPNLKDGISRPTLGDIYKPLQLQICDLEDKLQWYKRLFRKKEENEGLREQLTALRKKVNQLDAEWKNLQPVRKRLGIIYKRDENSYVSLTKTGQHLLSEFEHYQRMITAYPESTSNIVFPESVLEMDFDELSTKIGHQVEYKHGSYKYISYPLGQYVWMGKMAGDLHIPLKIVLNVFQLLNRRLQQKGLQNFYAYTESDRIFRETCMAVQSCGDFEIEYVPASPVITTTDYRGETTYYQTTQANILINPKKIIKQPHQLLFLSHLRPRQSAYFPSIERPA